MTNQEIQKLRTGILDSDGVEKLKGDVQRYLEWVIGIAGIFAIAQTVAAGFAAQSFSGQAERTIDQLDEFKKEYEGLVVAERSRKDALKKLCDFVHENQAQGNAHAPRNALAEGLDWRDGLYESMERSLRQRVLSIDRYLGYDLTLDPDDETTPSVLRLLANFYVTKFEYERRFGSGTLSDLERAEYLLHCWIKVRPEQFELRNDLGVVYSRLASHFGARSAVTDSSAADRAEAARLEEFYRELAREHFAFSLKYRPKQQRALYNLAFIARTYDHDLDLAIEQLEKARRIPVWEHHPLKAMCALLLYNLACYRALRAVSGTSGVKADESKKVVELLEECAQAGTIPASVVAADMKEGGDFYDLLERAPGACQEARSTAKRLRNLAPRLSAHRQPVEQTVTE